MIIHLILSVTGLDFLSAVSGAATSISNVGPGLGEMIGQTEISAMCLIFQNGYFLLQCCLED